MLRCGISSVCPDCLWFVGRYVHAEAPPGNVRAFSRQRRVQRRVRRDAKGTAEPLQFLRGGDLVQVEWQVQYEALRGPSQEAERKWRSSN